MAETLYSLRFICCGRSDGVQVFDSWEEADELRQSYTSARGHDRAAILSVAALEGEDT